jgi:dipeptidyl aminopeptidase/acylaminoacyl peptidase
MTPSDIAHIAVVEELDVSRDGATAVVARRIVRRGHYEKHLYAVALDGRHRPRRLTEGRYRDRSLHISPDGTSVAFLRGDPGDEHHPADLCTLPIAGGPVHRWIRVRSMTGFGGIKELAWSPDGGSIAFTADVDPPRFIVGDHPEIGTPAWRSPARSAPTARRITRTDWRWDELGHRDHWAHLFVLDLEPGAKPRQITSGDWGVSGITWHPDGRTVAFVSDRGPEPDLRPCNSIWGVDVDAGPRSKRSRPRRLMEAPGGANRPAFSTDGRWLAAVGLLEPEPLDDLSPGLLLGRADGSSAPVSLSAHLDRPIGNWADTDLNGWMVTSKFGPAWLDDRTIVAALTDRGRSLPERWVIDPSTGELAEAPTVNRRDADDPWADATTHMLGVAPATTDRPGRVVTLGTLGGRAMDVMSVDVDVPVGERRFRTHTTFGSSWQRAFVQPRMERIEVPGPGGPIETWIASPPDAGGEPLPTIVDIHGGPLGCWAPAPSNEVTMLIGAGYRVVLPNIRGSAGYGRDWIRPQLGDWGGVDADDVHAAVDHVIGLGLADSDRLGALGLSYGGFMVNWLVATSDRFAAAVSENGVTNQVSVWANSDSGPEYDRASLLGDPFSPAGIDKLWRQSPLRHVTNVDTPLLMLQAEADLRCPPQDNEQFFIALRHLRRTVEYVLYPEESHVYASAGRPDRRIDRMERVLDWFGRYLG